MDKNKLNRKQRYALDTMLSGRNVFLTGDAGTGKTTVIQTFIEESEKAGKDVLVCATTGIAADNIGYGAMTVHRALEISVHFEKYKGNVKKRTPLLEAADVLIIDEISMCRFDLFNMIAKTIALENEERGADRMLMREGAREDVQLIVIGDFFQLPPVITSEDRNMLMKMYGNEYGKGGVYEHGYAFMSPFWKEMYFEYIRLDEVCRQSNEAFKYILNDIKYGSNIRKAISYLEVKCAKKVLPAPFLVGTNAEADRINQGFLEKLNPETERAFEAEITGDLKSMDIKNIGFAKEYLVINIGARVIITVNDTDGKYVNGTIGTIIDIAKDRYDKTYLSIKSDKGQVIQLYQYLKEIDRQVVKETKKKVDGEMVVKEKIAREGIGSFKQFPVKLAWAISIHKSQGQTFDSINIDPCCWDPGQFYVAVSRAKKVEGIHFIRPIKQTYIKAFSSKNQKLLEESF